MGKKGAFLAQYNFLWYFDKNDTVSSRFEIPMQLSKAFWLDDIYDILSYQLGGAVMGLQKFICLRKVRYSPAKRTNNYLESGLLVLEHKHGRKQLCDTSAPEFRLKFLA